MILIARVPRLFVAVGLCCIACLVATAASQPEHEHAYGEDLGSVSLRTNCDDSANAQVQRGLALLHHMMYEGAASAFAAASQAQPSCAMANWGQAMAFVHPLWSDPPDARKFAQGKSLIETAMAQAVSTPRERAYIEAVHAYYAEGKTAKEAANLSAFARAWASVHARYPDDPEAALFHALGQSATADPSDKTFSQQRRAGQLIETVFARNPNHPGAHHYIIHAYDYPPLPIRLQHVRRFLSLQGSERARSDPRP